MRLAPKSSSRDRNDRVKPRQEMKTIMREPDPKPERCEHIRITHSHGNNRPRASTPNARQPRRQTNQQQRLNDQKQSEDKHEHRNLTTNSQDPRKPTLERVNRTHHSKRIQQSTKRKHDHESRQIFAHRKDPQPG